MLDIKSLNYFIAAYEERSISAAALRCFIAQPSISHAIKNLESKLNTTLFQRSRSGLIPTTSGNELYEKAHSLINFSNEIERHFKQAKSNHVSIFFQGDISIARLEPLIKLLKSQYGYIFNWVPKINQADIAIIDEEFIGKRFTRFPLFKESFQVIVPKQHILASKQKLVLSDIHKQAFIERPYCSQRTQFQKRLSDENISIHMAAQADNDLQVLELVKLGFGLAAMPSTRLTSLPNSLKAIDIDIQQKREVIMAVRTSRKDIVTDVNQLNWPWLSNQIQP